MKRILFGLGCSLALAPAVAVAQDGSSARLGRPQSNDVIARGLTPAETPKPMPKGAVTEQPKSDLPMLPMPTLAGPATGGPTIVLDSSGVPVASGPVVPGSPVPGTTIVSPPIPMGPGIHDPEHVLAAPMPGLMHTDGSRWYTSVEALMIWVKSYGAPALVSVGPANSGGTLAPGAGSSILYGAQPVDTNPRYGARFTLGRWFSPNWAVEASVFYTRPDRDRFRILSENVPNQDLARPFFSLNRGSEFSQLIGRPGVVSGYAQVDAKSQLYGAELNLRKHLWQGCANRVDLLVGYRYIGLDEELLINESARGLAGAGALAGVERAVNDRFETNNRFHGGQVGAIFQHSSGNWTWDLRAKVAVGMNRQTSIVGGGVVPIAGPTTPPDLPGGLLALNSNSGVLHRSTLTVVPEIGLNVGYDVTSRLRVFAGASFLYMSNVARPGAQIDRVLDENRIPDFVANQRVPAPAANGVRPVGQINSESFWAAGFNVGLLFRW